MAMGCDHKKISGCFYKPTVFDDYLSAKWGALKSIIEPIKK